MIFDTGASGVILFEGPANTLDIPVADFGDSDVVFSDVGVGGSTTFNVSDPVHMSLGHFNQDTPNAYDAPTEDVTYPRQYPDLRLQLGPPGITVSLDGNQAAGTFLLDTGSQISSISSDMAASLNVRYVPETEGTLTPMLEIFDPENLGAPGTLVTDQFSVNLTGIGGDTTIAGFYLDSLLARTLEGDPLDDSDPDHLNFLGAPVFVQDIELTDPITFETFIFDGILGTNFLFGSGDLSALAGFRAFSARRLRVVGT